jgi:hypothetical protein
MMAIHKKGSFIAANENGQRRIIYFDCTGPIKSDSLRTAAGQHVSRTGHGCYEIVETGERLASTDRAAV